MHKKFLLAALEQAKLGSGLCAPNPSVGAVAVHNGVIIAQSWHKGAGTPHAERLLLTQIVPKTPGISVYITLEPCNHWGRTPPCVDALIDHGIEQVFFSYLDPNPLVAKNNSSAQLRAQGVAVSHIPLKEVDDFYRSYAYWMETGKPWVTVKMAQTLDGMIGQSKGERIILSNAPCEIFTHEQRSACDVILTTARTINRDNPRLNIRLAQPEQKKPIAIIDRHLSTNVSSVIFSTALHCLIYHGSSSNKGAATSYPNSTCFAMPESISGIDLSAIIQHLGSLGYHDVWVEAGGAMFTSLHEQNLVNRTYLYLVPQALGPQAISAYQSQTIFQRKHTVSWHAMGDNMILCLDWQEDTCLRV